MLNNVEINEVLLEAKQVAILSSLLKKRFRIFLAGVFAVFICWFKACFACLNVWYIIHFVSGARYVELKFLDKINYAFGTSVIMLVGFSAYFIYLFLKKILPLYKDSKEKMGFIKPMKIVRKSIPYGNKCFFFFDDLEIPYKEVDYTTYYSFHAADNYPVLIAKYSNTHIDEYLNMPLL